MAAVRDTGGMFLRISDQEILAAIPQLAALTGVFAEPAAAAAYGGLMKAVEGGYLAPDMRVVVISTGSGLKDIDSAMQGVQASGAAPIRVPPSLRDLNAKLRL
jgi:threonine synthase